MDWVKTPKDGCEVERVSIPPVKRRMVENEAGMTTRKELDPPFVGFSALRSAFSCFSRGLRAATLGLST